jgi:hypothetical protein
VNLQGNDAQDQLNVRQQQWSKILSEYDFDIAYFKGNLNNIVVDTLSRRPHMFFIFLLKTNLREHILGLQ